MIKNIEELKELVKFTRRTGKTENFIKSLNSGDIAVTEMSYPIFSKIVSSITGLKVMPVTRDTVNSIFASIIEGKYNAEDIGILFIDVKQFILFKSILESKDELNIKDKIRTKIKVDPEIFTDYIDNITLYPEGVSQENINKVRSLSTDLIEAEIRIRKGI